MEKKNSLQHCGEKLTSNATFLDIQDEREKEVFNFLVKECGGCASVKKLKEKFSPRFGDFDNWLSREKKILRFYKKNGQIINVLPFLKDATICVDHYMKNCERENCESFHVCKFYMDSYCKKDDCNLGHTFTVGNNKEIKHKLGLNSFSDDEMRTILKCKYPQVCPATKCESDDPNHCPYLHVCYRYTRNKCREERCEKGHTLNDPHNEWVLSVYEMKNWPVERPGLFNAVITVLRKHRKHSTEDEETSHESASSPRKRMKEK